MKRSHLVFMLSAIVPLVCPNVVFAASQEGPAPVTSLTLPATAVSPVINTAPVPVLPVKADSDLENRLGKLERLLDNQGLVELMTKMESMQKELQQLQGQLEEQGNLLEGLQQRQRDAYLDTDRRLSQLERITTTPAPAAVSATTQAPGEAEVKTPEIAPAAEPAVETPATVPAAPPPPVTEAEKIAYQKAISALKEGRYADSILDFQALLKSSPNGAYADNAQYWLGEAYYVTRDYNKAQEQFNKIFANPASRKRPDAMLKLGYTYFEQQQWGQARKQFEGVISSFPKSPAAKLAQKKLQELDKAGH